MATLDELQTRIILDTNRDDLGSGGELAQALADAIADAIESYVDEPFWFNRMSGSVDTLANEATVALPADMRLAELVRCQGAALRKVPLERIEGRTETGLPCRWANEDGGLHLWPVPDAAYTLDIFGVADLGVPGPGEANAWTEEGYRLILAGAKKILYRGSLRDPEGMQLARDEEEEALGRLRRETRRRAASPLASDLPAGAGFSIVAGR